MYKRQVYVGGVVGAQIDGAITGCSSSTTVKGMVDVGGVAGQTNSSATLTACSVSYTHLDVYKRQGLLREYREYISFNLYFHHVYRRILLFIFTTLR